MVKGPPANAGDTRDVGWSPGCGRAPGVGTGNLLQRSCLGNPMDRGAWRATVHEVTKSLAQLSTHTEPRLPPTGASGAPGQEGAAWDLGVAWWAGAQPALGLQRQPRDACVSQTGLLPKVLCCSHTGHRTPAVRADVVPAQPSPVTLGGRLLSAWWGQHRRKTRR